MNLDYRLNTAVELLDEAHSLGFEQLNLFNENKLILPPCKIKNSTIENSTFEVQEDRFHINVHNGQFSYQLDKQKGIFSRIEKAGKAIIQQPLDFNIWRAPTDNDRLIREAWQNAGYDKAYTRAYEIQWQQSEQAVEFSVKSAIVSISRGRILTLDICYRIFNDGQISMEINAIRPAELPYLPRFGLRFWLSKAENTVEYFGYGEQESYVDKHHLAKLGIYRTTAKQIIPIM
ncbi:beta-galactosidase/beta-glucuronidase [Actinobacillus equuli]|nr:beta-galactosidase/beta-glucuronidase [Actinobacillus equuli]